MKKTIALLAASLAVLTAGPAAAGIIYGTTGTGGPGTRDTNWKVLAAYTGYTPPSGQSYPYNSYVYTVVPHNWNGTGGFGQTQVGYTNADGTFYWIGTASTPGSALPFPDQYGYIIGQSFEAVQAGMYDFSFPANGDNLFSFFINGSISYADPMKPTITGGTQIGLQSGDFQNIKILAGSAYLNSGTNWAYAVIDERGFSTFANTLIPALTSIALLAKREAKLTVLGGTPTLLGEKSAPTERRPPGRVAGGTPALQIQGRAVCRQNSKASAKDITRIFFSSG